MHATQSRQWAETKPSQKFESHNTCFVFLDGCLFLWSKIMAQESCVGLMGILRWLIICCLWRVYKLRPGPSLWASATFRPGHLRTSGLSLSWFWWLRCEFSETEFMYLHYYNPMESNLFEIGWPYRLVELSTGHVLLVSLLSHRILDFSPLP
jgi:hypothetical protein